ncbi:MAG: hypothetical protein HC810_06615 [Acaryochloridaceae cyanobacterium RL_2_7]|nr:hypothetical protein [Acaryochloridaceae cyanobacterium RL_2_7]
MTNENTNHNPEKKELTLNDLESVSGGRMYAADSGGESKGPKTKINNIEGTEGKAGFTTLRNDLDDGGTAQMKL